MGLTGVTDVAEITRSISITDFSRAKGLLWLQSQTQELEEFFFLTHVRGEMTEIFVQWC